MATIYKEFLVSATPQFVWDAIKDVREQRGQVFHFAIIKLKTTTGSSVLCLIARPPLIRIMYL